MSGMPILEELRPRAFAVAYRMLGSLSEAEDIVQEALLRLHLTLQQGERIESPRAYLSTVVTRLCIDHADRQLIPDRPLRQWRGGPGVPRAGASRPRRSRQRSPTE
jgi:DNA-directed RNA polymerase specialized sigma24 family protein